MWPDNLPSSPAALYFMNFISKAIKSPNLHVLLIQEQILTKRHLTQL